MELGTPQAHSPLLSVLPADFFLSPQPALLLSEEEEHLLLVFVYQCMFTYLLYFDDWWMRAGYQFPASLQGKYTW